ncbi:hypothetical protein EYF80_058995 [Liparis tanakae]|uniref:Uncharacterized protein n=1 Tax=Liparis tanakae TaxID=230148 RepID=A0A4Z2ERC9_9TELE|nr:hypothetical protein EYF80_058995 [Liparis tanakae]
MSYSCSTVCLVSASYGTILAMKRLPVAFSRHSRITPNRPLDPSPGRPNGVRRPEGVARPEGVTRPVGVLRLSAPCSIGVKLCTTTTTGGETTAGAGTVTGVMAVVRVDVD